MDALSGQIGDAGAPQAERRASTPSVDLERLGAARSGDPLAVAWLEERLLDVSRFLCALNRRFGGGLDPDSLDDLAQDTMLKAWTKLERYEGQSAFAAWLYRFCSFEYMNALRARNRAPRTQALVDTATPSPVATTPIGVDQLTKKIGALKAEEALVLELRHVEGLDFADVGDRLSISAPAAKTRYYRALRRLRALFDAPSHENN